MLKCRYGCDGLVSPLFGGFLVVGLGVMIVLLVVDVNPGAWALAAGAAFSTSLRLCLF